jgi:dUTP pyrophosphatase
MSQLYIYAEDRELYEKYRQYLSTRRPTDSGVDVFLPADTSLEGHAASLLPLKIVVAAKTYLGSPAPCLLVPRSSISKTSLRLANSIGLIDSGYRGEVSAAVDNMSEKSVEVQKHNRLFQICAHDFLPYTKISLVDRREDLPVPPDDRGAGGFGSTGR